MKFCATTILMSLALQSCTAPRATNNSYLPPIDPQEFQAVVDNPWMPLVPGTVYRYVEKKDGVKSDVEVTVTQNTKSILGVNCVVVHDLLTRAGQTVEDTYDWYAQDSRGNVWYFGEDTREYDDKGHVDLSGSWQAGVKGAQPGIVMPANPVAGAPYRQEYLRGQAEDMGQVIATGDSVSVPYGSFTPSVQTREWSELESGSERKWYARGIGFIRSQAEDGEVSELVAVSRAP
jgi:hypothetical protein